MPIVLRGAAADDAKRVARILIDVRSGVLRIAVRRIRARQEIGLLRARRHAGRRTAALNVEQHGRNFGEIGEAEEFLHRFMPYAPLVHTADEVRSWVRTSLAPSPGTVVAERNGEVVAVLAMQREPACSWIMQMAVDPAYAGTGIGSALLEHAFAVLPSPIRLYIFEANAGARRFYERHGFRAIQLTDGQDNEERCPDVLYEFVAPGRILGVSSPTTADP